MADKNTQEKKASVSRKKLVGLQRDRMYNRVLVIGTVVIVLLVVGLVGWGVVQERIIYPSRTVAIVEGDEIKGDEFQTRVRLNRQQAVDQYINLVLQLQFFGADPSIQQEIYSQLTQIQFQLLPSTVGSQSVNQLVEEHLMALEAEERGIVIPDKEVDQAIQQFFGYFADGQPPTNTPFPTSMATSTLSATQLALVSPTPEVTATSTPAATAAASPTAAATEASDAAATPLAAAGGEEEPLTFEQFQSDLADYVDLQESEIGFDEEDLRYLVWINLVRDALFEQVVGEVPTTQEQVWARHILVEDEETAQEVLDRLSDGEDWNDLASEYSLDTINKDQGGELGWFDKTTMVAPFSEAAFEMEVGETSDPVETQFGFHIIQVLGHEERPLTATAMQQLREEQFQDFLRELRAKYEWEIFDNWFEITPEEPEIPLEYRLSNQ